MNSTPNASAAVSPWHAPQAEWDAAPAAALSAASIWADCRACQLPLKPAPKPPSEAR